MTESSLCVSVLLERIDPVTPRWHFYSWRRRSTNAAKWSGRSHHKACRNQTAVADRSHAVCVLQKVPEHGAWPKSWGRQECSGETPGTPSPIFFPDVYPSILLHVKRLIVSSVYVLKHLAVYKCLQFYFIIVFVAEKITNLHEICRCIAILLLYFCTYCSFKKYRPKCVKIRARFCLSSPSSRHLLFSLLLFFSTTPLEAANPLNVVIVQQIRVYFKENRSLPEGNMKIGTNSLW